MPSIIIPPIQQQLRNKWCWAACTVYICRIYQTHNALTQSALVANVFNMPICRSNFPHPDCNRMFDLGGALNSVGHLDGSPIDEPLPQQEIVRIFRQGGQAIGCQIRFPDFGHAVVIANIRVNGAGVLFLVVADPGSGSINTVPYSEFRSNYLNRDGRWIRTYLTT